ncbi:hypothetical protein [Clostridium sp.]|uniref:hypothetical protein n=1 Tax=Clostridium sp. TaxID=1506 RepID=UPI0032175EEC
MIRIEDVEIIPNTVKVSQAITIRVVAREANWSEVSQWYSSWDDLKLKLLNWQTLKDI